jgi:hypothetical protein
MSAAMFAKMKELEARIKAVEDLIRQARDNVAIASASPRTLKLPEKGKAA